MSDDVPDEVYTDELPPGYIRIELPGAYELGKLYEELVAAIPGLAPHPSELRPGRNEATLLLMGNEDGSAYALVPEGTSPAAMKKVAAAHEPDMLADQRAAAREPLIALLASTDKWAARAYEDGTPMPPERVAYRKALRALLGKIEAATTQAQLDKISVPDPPPNPS